MLLLFSAIYTGWPAILIVLKAEGQYSELCNTSSPSSLDFNTSEDIFAKPSGSEPFQSCPEQDVALNMIITISFLCAGFSELMGPLTDRVGPKFTFLTAGLLIVPGLFLMAYSDSKTFDAFLPGMIMLSFGGTGLWYGHASIATLFTTRRRSIISSLSALWILGGTVVLAFQVFYFNLHFTRKTCIFAYAVFAIIMFLTSFLFLSPLRAWKPGDTARITPIWTLVVEEWRARKYSKVATQEAPVIELDSKHDTKTEAPQQSVLWQFVRWNFWLGLIYIVPSFYTVTYAIGTIEIQLVSKGDTTGIYVQLFTLLGCLSIVFIPFIGLGLDHFGIIAMSPVGALLPVLWGAVNAVHNLPLQIFSFVVFAAARETMASIFHAFVLDVVPSNQFGTVVGFSWLTVMGVTQTQNRLVKYILEDLKGDWTIPNICVACLPLLSLTFPVVLLIRKRYLAKHQPPPEVVAQKDETTRLLP
jgi:hypothetical protein